MGEIKSAREIANEKIEKLGEPTEEERLGWKYLPEGEKLAARFLKSDSELLPELNKYDKKATKYVTEGISHILLKNLIFPKMKLIRNLISGPWMVLKPSNPIRPRWRRL